MATFVILVPVASSLQAQSLSRNGNPVAHFGGPAVEVIGPTSITQSTSQTVVAASTVSCNNGAGGGFMHTDNSYYRAFTLSTFNPPLTTTQFRVDSVTIGIETANAAGTGTTQPLTINVFSSSANPPTLATLSAVLGTATVAVSDQALTSLVIPIPAQPVFTVASGILVVEIFTPNGQTGGHSMFVGSNALGQSGPTFIRSAPCGIPDITNMNAIGFPNVHLVMTVSGNSQAPVSLESITVD